MTAPLNGLNELDCLRIIAGNILANGGGGGSSSPQLPVWTFQASDSSTPTTGKFTTNNADPSQATVINLHNVCKQGVGISATYGELAIYNTICLISATTGKMIFVEFLSSVGLGDPSDGYAITYETDGVPSETAWGGDYYFSLGPNGSNVSTLAASPTAGNVTVFGAGNVGTIGVVDSGVALSSLATQAYVDAAIAAFRADATALLALMTSAGITPFTGSVTPVTEVDANTGIVTGVS